MLAVQKSSDSSQESMFSGLNVNQNIDVSLLSSFPAVPTAPVVLENKSIKQQELTPPNSGAILSNQKEESYSLSTSFASAPTLESQVVPSAPVTTTVTESKKKAANFSALYAAEVRIPKPFLSKKEVLG